METRLIVALRTSRANRGTTPHSTALFGTYIWNDAETEAVLLTDPLRSGKPFSDRLIAYLTNEEEAEADHGGGRIGPAKQAHRRERWRAPTRSRAASAASTATWARLTSFVLGFTPLQINRRPDATRAA